MFRKAGIPLIRPVPQDGAGLKKECKQAMDRLKDRVDGVYLHIDMDVLETGTGKPNHLAVPGGLLPEVVEDIIREIKTTFTIRGCTIASYDPAYDVNHSVCNAGIGIISRIVDTVADTGN
jgi:arginase family enzyme